MYGVIKADMYEGAVSCTALHVKMRVLKSARHGRVPNHGRAVPTSGSVSGHVQLTSECVSDAYNYQHQRSHERTGR